MLTFNSENSKETLTKEWLVTNGIGGYASGTISGANTRRYHGLLVASLNPPIQRQVLVTKIEETIVSSDGSKYSLSSNYFPGVIHPDGYHYIEGFERGPLPTTIFSVKGHLVKKTIFMVHGSNTTIVAYKNTGKNTFKMILNPFYVYRDYHSLYHEDSEFCHYFGLDRNTLEVYTCHLAEPLYVKYSSGKFTEEYNWFKNYQYPEEQKRGQDYTEDAFSIGNFELKLKPGETFYITFSTDKKMAQQSPENLKQQELKRLKSLIPQAINDTFLKDLIVSANQFIVNRKSTGSKSIIAGYHWFTDWGRDTMIAMQGLTIAIGDQETSKSILSTFLKSIDQGMLPNRFADNENEQPEYNTIDATLWLFVSLYKYYEKFGDAKFITENIHYLEDILQAHINGTRYKIHVTEQGLLYGGEGIKQLTWMDARVGDYVVTPRHGCPVEIQALWYNALQVNQFFGKEFPNVDFKLKTESEILSKKLTAHFLPYFLNSDGYLNDVIGLDFKGDKTIRPNQIFALSLPFPLLDKNTGKSILEVVESHLFTPFGLRTLSPDSPDFCPVYKGNQWERDTSYHQGTVWPFLLADYFMAYSYVYGNTKEVSTKIELSLNALSKHFYESDCINGISEIFDGFKPQEGKGAVQQAWSVSSIIQLQLMYNNLKNSDDKKIIDLIS
ncbi:MAG: amylo-alpha-1,6-glucosidase [Lentimicrobium sp.]|nr:amylo-alpha-1,6-glucosidase [Lentimicrobium sp.]